MVIFGALLLPDHASKYSFTSMNRIVSIFKSTHISGTIPETPQHIQKIHYENYFPLKLLGTKMCISQDY
jgi:hypothetical protein